MIQKISVIIGHEENKQGSVSYWGESEFSFNCRVAGFLQDMLNQYDIECFSFRKVGLNYSNIADFYKKVGVDLSIELHCNSYYKVARGLECLMLEGASRETYLYADAITDYVSAAMDIKERHTTSKIVKTDGVYAIERHARGAVCLKGVEKSCKHALLFEPCFWNTKNPDSEKLKRDNGYFYAQSLCSAIVKTFSIGEKTSKPVDEWIKQLENVVASMKASRG